MEVKGKSGWKESLQSDIKVLATHALYWDFIFWTVGEPPGESEYEIDMARGGMVQILLSCSLECGWTLWFQFHYKERAKA